MVRCKWIMQTENVHKLVKTAAKIFLSNPTWRVPDDNYVSHTRLFLMSFDGSNRVPYLYYSLPNFWVMCQKKKIIFFKISIVLSISNREKNKLYMDSWPPFRPSVFCSKYSIGKKRKPRIKRSLKNQKGKQKKCLELTLWSWFVGRMPGSPKFYRS